MTHDFLKLLQRDFSKYRLLVFFGASGSGKSTALRLVAESHPQFREQKVDWILGSPICWGRQKANSSIVLVDEVHSLKDAANVYSLVASGKQVFIASHMPGWVFWPLRIFGRLAVFVTDSHSEKLGHYLRSRQIEFSSEALQAFVSKYRATYTDLEIILERSPGQSFDDAFRSFERFSSLSVERPDSFSRLSR